MTICVHGGECLLGDVADGEMRRNAWGQIVLEEWLASQEIRRELQLDAFVVMPNHIHGVVWISATDPVGPHVNVSVVGAHGSPVVMGARVNVSVVGAHGNPVVMGARVNVSV